VFLEQGTEIVALIRHSIRAGAHPANTWAAQIVDHNARIELLTPRQRDILDQLAIKRTTKEIARNLGLSPETVKHHLKTIFERLEVSSREEAIAAIQQDRRKPA
jgi:DNA-binding CsgD family transcriptional regulator